MSLSNLIKWQKPGLKSENNLIQRSFFDEFDRFFDGFFNTPEALFQNSGSFTPNVNVEDNGKNILVSAELPGLDDKDIQVSVDGDMLTIKGEKKKEQKKETSGFYHMERHFGSFQRRIRLPAEINVDRVKASFRNGILNIDLPKLDPEKSNVKYITVKAS